MVEKLDSCLYFPAARHKKHGYESHHWVTCRNVAFILMIATGFVSYTRFLLQDVIYRSNFPGFLTPDPTAENLYYSFSEEANERNDIESIGRAPTTPLINVSIDKSNDTATQHGGDYNSMNVPSQEKVQVVNSTPPPPPPPPPPAPATKSGGDGSKSTTANSNNGPSTAMNVPSQEKVQVVNSTPPPPPPPPPPAPATKSGGDGSKSTTADSNNGPSTAMNVHKQDAPDGSIANYSTSTSPAKFSVLVGVFIMHFEFKRREIIRLAYRVQSSPYADFTVRFILGGYKLESWLEPENSTYGDMIVLQCKENLNLGKTFTFFSSVPDLVHKHDYVMKADDDSYVNFENLGKHMNSFPRTDLYYGYSLPCDDDDPGHVAAFRVGAGYVLSWDLVVWIKESPIPRNNSIGTEDFLVGEWFRQGDIAKNRPYSMHLFHDHPDQGGKCCRPVTNESILIHKLKTNERWYAVINFFNASRSVTN
ncbi:unnamed protein product [Calypogeia fissa]